MTEARGVWHARLTRLAERWERPAPSGPGDWSGVLDLGSPHEVWVGLYALSASMPTHELVVDVVRRCALEGPSAFEDGLAGLASPATLRREVELVVGATLVDVSHTAQIEFRTGVQRVAAETAARWHRRHGCVLVGWTRRRDALRVLDPDLVESLLAKRPGPGFGPVVDDGSDRVLVPLGGTYLAPELTWSKTGLLSLSRHARMATGVIGFDCVGLTMAETATPTLPAEFARYLAGLRHVDRVVAISEASAAEFRGWTRMLAGAGLRGPAVDVVVLPDELDVTPDDDAARRLFAVGALPEVLVVGTHEPRKNHLAVLAAAETLWTEGLRFSLTFVGGRSWRDRHFRRTVARLQRAGRPLATMAGVTDAALAGGYRRARFSVYPSLSEGFGLPVAESLGLGTPVITSGYGSMREIAAAGGCLLVDPRDDDDLAGAMRRLLTDDALLARLRAEAAERPVRTWDDYAEETWAALTAEAVS